VIPADIDKLGACHVGIHRRPLSCVLPGSAARDAQVRAIALSQGMGRNARAASSDSKVREPTMEPESQQKETKTAEELAAMILEDLRKVDGCPNVG